MWVSVCECVWRWVCVEMRCVEVCGGVRCVEMRCVEVCGGEVCGDEMCVERR